MFATRQSTSLAQILYSWNNFIVLYSTIKERFGKESSLSLSKTNVENLVAFLTA